MGARQKYQRGRVLCAQIAKRLLIPAGWLWVGLAQAGSCPAVGAIRWDAWFGDKGLPGRAVEKSLGPARWHGRLPTCATVLSTDQVKISCDSAAQMSLEIDQAAAAGLSYWAFVAYPDDDPMSDGLKTYLRNAGKPKIGFALISEMDKWGDRQRYPAVIERYVGLMSDPQYQRTAHKRPLFYLGFISDVALDSRFGGRQGFARAVAEFRALAIRKGAGDPYIVLLDGNVERGKSFIHDLGLDAISAYAVSDAAVQDGDFRQLAALAAAFWTRASRANLALVPPVMTGWDRRPRVQTPVPWESGTHGDEQMQRYFKPPSDSELEAHLAAAMRFVAHDAKSTEPNAVLVYAWNEFDEGGWLAPTQGDGNRRLDAVRKAVSAVCAMPATSASTLAPR